MATNSADMQLLLKTVMLRYCISIITLTVFTFRSTPRGDPHLVFLTAYGAWLMLSVPPVNTTSASPNLISCNNNYNMIQRQCYYYLNYCCFKNIHEHVLH